MIFSFTSTATVLSVSAAAYEINHFAGGLHAIPVVEAEPTPVVPRAALNPRDARLDCVTDNMRTIGYPFPTGTDVEISFTTGGLGAIPNDPICSVTVPASQVPALSSFYLAYSEFLNTAEEKASSSITDFCGGEKYLFSASMPCRSSFTLIGTGAGNMTATPTTALLPSITKVLDVTLTAGGPKACGAATHALAAGVGVALAAVLAF